MSERLSPKEIKRDIREDEVSHFLLDMIDWVVERRKTLAQVGIGIVALVVLAGVVTTLQGNKRKAASNQLAEAMDTYEESVELAEDDEVDRAKAREAFEQVSGGGVATDVANLYLADLAIEEGDTEKARSIWQSFVDAHPEHMLGVSVRMNLMSLDRQEGRGEDVVTALRQEIDATRKSLPEDVALYELARTLSHLGRDDEAEEIYQQLIDDHGASPYAAEARRYVAEATI